SCSFPRAGRVIVGLASRSSFLFEHDLFGKPVSTFPDHALDRIVLRPARRRLGARRRFRSRRRGGLRTHCFDLFGAVGEDLARRVERPHALGNDPQALEKFAKVELAGLSRCRDRDHYIFEKPDPAGLHLNTRHHAVGGTLSVPLVGFRRLGGDAPGLIGFEASSPPVAQKAATMDVFIFALAEPGGWRRPSITDRARAEPQPDSSRSRCWREASLPRS